MIYHARVGDGVGDNDGDANGCGGRGASGLLLHRSVPDEVVVMGEPRLNGNIWRPSGTMDETVLSLAKANDVRRLVTTRYRVILVLADRRPSSDVIPLSNLASTNMQGRGREAPRPAVVGQEAVWCGGGGRGQYGGYDEGCIRCRSVCLRPRTMGEETRGIFDD